jgi:hypothetical protein
MLSQLRRNIVAIKISIEVTNSLRTHCDKSLDLFHHTKIGRVTRLGAHDWYVLNRADAMWAKFRLCTALFSISIFSCCSSL